MTRASVPTLRFGIDLGGTKTEILALGPGGEERYRRRIASPQGDYRATLEAIAGLIASAESDTGEQGSIGIGIPGAISPASGRVKNANSTWLIGEALDRDLAARLERPVRLENDANCFALSEAMDGAAAGAAVVFGVILGTGVGGGLVVAGRVLRGRHLIAGEWGHNPLPRMTDAERPGPACYCGRHGCIETFLSGPALSADHRAATGQTLGAEAIAAAEDSPEAQATLARFEERLARALAGVVNLVDPDAIVLGGGLSRLSRLYRNLPALLPAGVFSDVCDTPILPPKHGDASGVRGAAWLWRPEELAHRQEPVPP